MYVALSGLNYETRAEYHLIRKLGGDVVGMSTTPEVAVDSRLQVPVLGIRVVTNVARPDALETTSGEDVVHAARNVEAPSGKSSKPASASTSRLVDFSVAECVKHFG